MEGKRASLIIVDDTIENSGKPLSKMEEDNAKMKAMMGDLRNQLFQAVQKNEALEQEMSSSIRLFWAAAHSQPDGVLKIPKTSLEMIDNNCQLESGYDPETCETWFRAVQVLTKPN